MSVIVIFTPMQLLTLVMIALIAITFFGVYVWGWITGACGSIRRWFHKNRDAEL